MPIEIAFADSYVRELCERRGVAESVLGAAAARQLRARLADIQAATSIVEVTAGWPRRVVGTDQLAFMLHPPQQLLLEPDVDPIPRTKNGEVKWPTIKRIRVVHVGEHSHERK